MDTTGHRELATVALLATLLGVRAAVAGTPAPLTWTGKWMGGETLRELETGRLEEVKSQAGPLEASVLSPDGMSLALLTSAWARKNDGRGVEIVDRRTGARQALMRVDGPSRIWWSPDGRFLTVQADQLHKAWLIQVAEKRIWKVPEGQPIWNPTCSSVSFLDLTYDVVGARSSVKIYRDDDGKRRRLWRSIKGRMADVPRLSPDGKTIAFSEAPDVVLWVRDLGTGKQRRLTPTFKPMRGEWAQFWSPDSRGIVVLAVDSQREPRAWFEVWDTVTGKQLPLSHEQTVFVPLLGAPPRTEWWQPPLGPAPDCRPLVTRDFGGGTALQVDGDGYVPDGRAKVEP